MVSSCMNLSGDYCKISEQQYLQLARNLKSLIKHISSDKLTYRPEILDNKYIYRQDGQCWCMLVPESLDGTGILDGELSVDVNELTMELTDLAEMAY